MNLTPHHTAISVRDIEKSLAFYEMLGYKEAYRFVNDDNTMTIVHMELGGTFLELFAFAENSNKPPVEFEYANNLKELGVKHIALKTDNLEVTFEVLKQEGLATSETELRDGMTGIRYFFIQDPDGVWVEIVEDKRSL